MTEGMKCINNIVLQITDQVRKSRTYYLNRDSKYILEGDDESELVKYNWKKMGGEIYAHIRYIYNKFKETREKEVWNARTQIKILSQNIQHQRPKREMQQNNEK